MFLTKEACNRHAPIMRAEATQLMYDFLKQPEVFPFLVCFLSFVFCSDNIRHSAS